MPGDDTPRPDAPESALPPEPWKSNLIRNGDIRIHDAAHRLIIKLPYLGRPSALASLLLAAPRTARRLARLERAARELLDSHDAGAAIVTMFERIAVLRSALAAREPAALGDVLGTVGGEAWEQARETMRATTREEPENHDQT